MVARNLPPYLAFNRFKEFLDRLADDGVPTHINRQYYGEFLQGIDESYIMGALRFFDLLEGDDQATDDLRRLAMNQDGERTQLLATRLEVYYADVLALTGDLALATREQLDRAFDGVFDAGETTLRKAATFFVNAAQYANMPLSDRVTGRTRSRTVPRIGSNARNGRTSTTKGASLKANGPERTEKHEGDTKTIALRSGGTVTLSVSVSWLGLDKEDREFVFGLTDRLTDYERQMSEYKEDGAALTAPSSL
jgi:hypothetical protein